MPLKSCLVALTLVTTGWATPSAKAAPFKATGVFFALSVENLDASARWYADKFNLTTRSKFSTEEASGVVMAGDGLEVELMAFRNSVARADPFEAGKPHPRGIVKVGFAVEDFDAAVAALKSKGVAIVLGPYPATKDQRANVLVRDNSGNLLQLFGGFAR